MKYFVDLYWGVGKVQYYTVRREDSLMGETEKFFVRVKQQATLRRDLEDLVAWLEEVGRRGAEERYFRFEDNVHAVPIRANKLRLYCIFVRRNVVILGGGGEKTAQKNEDSPDTLPHFKLMRRVEKAVREKIREREMDWDARGLLVGENEIELPW